MHCMCSACKLWAANVLPPSNSAWSFLWCKLCVMSTIDASIHACVCVYMFLFTPGTQNNSVVKSCLFAFSFTHFFFYFCFAFHLYFYTCLSIHPSSCACLSLSLSLSIPVSICVSRPSILSLSPCVIFLSINLIHFISIISSSLSISLSPFPHLSLSLWKV